MKVSYMWIDKSIDGRHPITGSRLNLKSLARLLSETGYNGVEIMIGNPFIFDYVDAKNIISEANLEISQLCTGEFWGSYCLCMNDIDKDKKEKALSWAEKVINLASILNCSVNIGRFRGIIWEDGSENSISRMVESFKYLDTIANNLGVRLLIEPLRKDICDNINSVSEAIEFINSAELKSCDIMIDTDHTSLEEIDFIKEYYSKVKYIHLADTLHAPLGKGVIPFSKYFELFKLIKYDGYLGIEVFSQNQEKDTIYNSLVYLKNFITKERNLWIFK